MATDNSQSQGNVELSYNIASMRLQGVVDGTDINIIAYSGGRGGSKESGAINNLIANNPFLTGIKLDERKKAQGSVGGALPMGTYVLQLHETKKNWIRLNPINVPNMHERAGFAIHGRGQRGSDGCIVPNDFQIVLKLCELVKARKDKKLPNVLLKVYAVGDLDFFLKNIDTWKRTA